MHGRLTAIRYHDDVTTLVRADAPDDRELDELRSTLTSLEAALSKRSSEVERFKTELAAFKVKYRQDVGLLHEELDELEHAIAEIELGVLKTRLFGVPDADEGVPRGGTRDRPVS